MAAFGESLRGDGLSRAQRALAALEQDARQLDHARGRFSHSPPPYTSHQSHNSTRSQSPNPPSEEQQRREDRRWHLEKDREASFPRDQFDAQTSEELNRIFQRITNRSLPLPVEANPHQLADEIVKKRWVEQGIWKDAWDDRHALSGSLYGRWKHEEPLEPEPESESDKEAETRPSLFSFNPKKPKPKPRRLQSEEEKQRVAERRATRKREREASRPFYQFAYQISKEREQIQAESETGEAATTTASVPDINTRAYKIVKSTWIKRGIWNERWGILPGMLWKHEEPFVDETSDEPASLQMHLPRNGSCEAGEAPTNRIFGPPSPAVSDHRYASGITNTSQQGLSAEMDLGNGTAEGARSATNSPHPGRNEQVLRSTTANTSLGLVHASKVSKAARRKRPALRRRPNVSQHASSCDPPISTRPDTAELGSQTVRRSKRIQDGIASSTDSHDARVQSRPMRTAARHPKSIDLAKPQGISKKPRSSRTRGRTRKDNN